MLPSPCLLLLFRNSCKRHSYYKNPNLSFLLVFLCSFGCKSLDLFFEDLELKEMNRGRRNLKQAASEQDFTLEECQSIAQVVSLRGSNQIEVSFCIYVLVKV